ncbi:MAG TPA: hypothetical protein DDW17_01005 [Deltaproteobacteria bacterium]|nr:hypothetical protein [Deltaproteobacteria bacterium]
MFDIRSQVENKILNYFFLNENSKVYINELARIIESDPKNIYRILLRLEKMGLLTTEFRGKERYFYLNKKNPLYKEYKNIFLKTTGIEALLRNKVHTIPEIKEAYIFGSYANNRYNSESDIDVLLVGTHSPLKVQRLFYKIQKNIGREINIVNITPSELKKRLDSGDQFIKNIFTGRTIKLL